VSVPVAILLPPSEGKAEGGAAPKWRAESGRFGGALAAKRRTLAAALAEANGGNAALLGVGGRHLERALIANRALVGAPTMPARARYVGVVHDHVGFADLPKGAAARAGESVVIVSGLLGLVALDDPIPDYRLKMGARLGSYGLLSNWWSRELSAVLNEWLQGRVVIDVLPAEHRAAWKPDPSLEVHQVRFVERSGKVAGHDAKAAKGLLVRHLLTSRAAPSRALAGFRHDRFDLDVS
jgi:cytoplasmic iron level regulating protein YaaA (DUF328/UPF0246 family)